MAPPRPTTIAEYIKAAAPVTRPHLRKLHQILKSVAPDAEEAIKWGVPFFVEPRFLFSFSAFKGYCVFVPSAAVLEHFREDLAQHSTTKNFLQLPYGQPLPDALIRKLVRYRLKHLGEGDGFWG